MKIESVELLRVDLPLVAPFTTSFGTQTIRRALLLRVVGKAPDAAGELVPVVGWGECVCLSDPYYSPEYLDGCAELMRRYLLPALFAAQADGHEITAETTAHFLRRVIGNPIAKAAVEMAILDAQLRGRSQSLANYFGVTRTMVPSGVSVGIMDTIPELLDTVAGYVDQGYVRIKLKIKPGWDLAPVRAVRERFGEELLLQVDANAAYSLVDAPLLRRLDDYGLLLIEQPLADDDLYQHAQLARMLRTPICLDESIVSAKSAADAIALGAVEIINIKPARVGGYLEARKIHDLAQAHGKAVWCGGMLETGLGRAANAALAGLSGFTLPGDISASDRFYTEDITEPFKLEDGQIRIPTGPGLGVEPIPEMLAKYSQGSVTVEAN
ncbi:o-succinylbenzoate synthase [Arthrobacter cryoconiti]|uniref:o-succinylbenzoate synthase n=1 Tax=Arthrobacter cryoconiti TaxID=748907 RepID=A0ABV8R3J8_9MICC|nr:o-succinylbenzoate synthase [Arthrobacter cryoconiti]MCC9067117.1 o-succinylbenzoate synthase [Arthrobacter cryoconiti]